MEDSMRWRDSVELSVGLAEDYLGVKSVLF